MNYEQLKNSILQEAIEGRLVPQDPKDEPAAVLLQRIREEKARLVKEKKIKKDKNESIIYRNADGHWMERFEDKKRPEVCIDEEVPFEIPKGWEWCRFGNLLINRDSERIPLSVSQREKLTKTYDYYGASGVIDKVDKYLFDKDLLLIGEDGANLINRSTPIAFIARGKYWVNNHAHVLDSTEPFLLIYVCLYINAISLVEYVTGTAQPKMNQEKMNSILIAVPPLSEQHRIVSRIEEIMPKVEEYGKAQEKLDALNAKLPGDLKNSILQEAIEGRLVPQDPKDEPAAVLLQRIREEKARLVKEKKIKKDKNESIIYRNADGHWMERFEDKKRPEVCIDEEIPFEIPETWEWCRLGKIVSTHPGKTPPRGDMRYWSDGKYPWVSISDMKQDGIITDTKEKVSEYAATKAFGNKISKAGSLLMSFKLTIGRTCLLGIDAYHNEAIITIETLCDSNNYTRDYLSKILPVISNWGESKDAIKGSTLNAKSIYNLLIPLPPLSEQHRIVAQLESLLPKVSRLTP
jgi:type I restriction enzyme S subunit